jgi:uncharacterized glyoxalase superfamily protein PhnB
MIWQLWHCLSRKHDCPKAARRPEPNGTAAHALLTIGPSMIMIEGKTDERVVASVPRS